MKKKTTSADAEPVTKRKVIRKKRVHKNNKRVYDSVKKYPDRDLPDGFTPEKLYNCIIQHLGIITDVAEALRVTRQTISNWRKWYPQVEVWFQEAQDAALDMSENVLHSMIKDDRNTTAVIFHLKTKGRKRGYIEHSKYTVEFNDVTKLRDDELAQRIKEIEGRLSESDS